MVAAMPKAATSTTPDATTSLIAAAERLFASRGIDGVSLREINREAGQRNTTSLQYHFGDRAGPAAGDHGQARRADRRPAQRAARPVRGQPHARHPGAGVGVHPAARRQAARSRRRTGLPAHRRRAGQPQQPGARSERAVDPARPAWSATPRQHHPLEPAGRAAAAAARRRAAAAPPLRGDALRPHRARPAGLRGSHQSDRLFTSHLVDLLVSILVTDVSEETRLLEERELQRAASARPAHPTRGRAWSAAGGDVGGGQGGQLLVGRVSTDASRSAWRLTAASNTLRTKRALPKPRSVARRR